MKYCKDSYEILCQGYPPEDDESFSAMMKQQLKNSRMQAFAQVIDYLEDQGISYGQIKGGFDIKVKDMILKPNMKVMFDGSKKLYQYNYDKVIKRVNK